MAGNTASSSGDAMSLPTALHSASGPGSTGGMHVRDWATSFIGRSRNDAHSLRRRFSHASHASHVSRQSKPRTPKWWKIQLFRGMVNDVRRRAPYYLDDWRDAWDYRVVPATVYMYFAKYEPPQTDCPQLTSPTCTS